MKRNNENEKLMKVILHENDLTRLWYFNEMKISLSKKEKN